jgi:TRAP-type mannitol/chloroaromatic compound transport system permease small subunit
MRILTALDRALGALIVLSNNLGSLLIVAMTIGVVADVTGRYIFNSPINGTHEMVTMAVVVILYLQLSYTLRSGRMTRSDAFYSRLLVKHPKTGNAVGFVFNVAGVCLAAAIMTGAWPKFVTAWKEDYYVGVIGVFTFPEWPLLLIIFLGCALLGLQFIMLAIANVLSLCGAAPRREAGAH